MSFVEVTRDGFGVLVLTCDCGATHRANGDVMRTTTGGVDAESRALRAFVSAHVACDLPAAFAVVGRPSRSRLVRELSRRPPAAAPGVLVTIREALSRDESWAGDEREEREWQRAVSWCAEAMRRRVRNTT